MMTDNSSKFDYDFNCGSYTVWCVVVQSVQCGDVEWSENN